MKKILAILLFVMFLEQTAYASEASPSADIASKLKEFQKEAASKAAQLKELIAKRLQNKAYIGSIESVSGSSLTLSAKSGPKMVSFSQDTLLPKKSLSLGFYVSALGDVDDTGVLRARKINLEATPSASTKTHLWGKIISLSEDLATLRDSNLKNVAVVFPKNSKIKVNDTVILTGSFEENVFKAGYVYVASKGQKRTATSSAVN